MDTPPVSAKVFGRILADTRASNIDPATFGGFWEQRNIAHYYEPYRSYKEIGRLSLDEAFRHCRRQSRFDPALFRRFHRVAALPGYAADARKAFFDRSPYRVGLEYRR
jgi:hypothetical protein